MVERISWSENKMPLKSRKKEHKKREKKKGKLISLRTLYLLHMRVALTRYNNKSNPKKKRKTKRKVPQSIYLCFTRAIYNTQLQNKKKNLKRRTWWCRTVEIKGMKELKWLLFSKETPDGNYTTLGACLMSETYLYNKIVDTKRQMLEEKKNLSWKLLFFFFF